MITRTLSAILAVNLLAGCATHTEMPLTTEMISAPLLRMDIAELESRLGEPSRKVRKDGKEVWIYREENSSGLAQLKGNCELEIGFTLPEVTSVTVRESGTTPLAQPLDACRPFYQKLRR
jgi:hypothetical protein